MINTKKDLTYNMVVDGWTKNCYYYSTFEKYAKECFGLTQKQLRELKNKKVNK